MSSCCELQNVVCSTWVAIKSGSVSDSITTCSPLCSFDLQGSLPNTLEAIFLNQYLEVEGKHFGYVSSDDE